MTRARKKGERTIGPPGTPGERPIEGEAYVRRVEAGADLLTPVVRVWREGSEGSDGSQAGVWTITYIDDIGQRRMDWVAWCPRRGMWASTVVLIEEAKPGAYVPWMPNKRGNDWGALAAQLPGLNDDEDGAEYREEDGEP